MAATHIVDAFFLERDFRITLGADEPLFLSSSGQSGKQYHDPSLSPPHCSWCPSSSPDFSFHVVYLSIPLNANILSGSCIVKELAMVLYSFDVLTIVLLTSTLTAIPVGSIFKTFRILEMIDQRNALTVFCKIYTSWGYISFSWSENIIY